MPVLGSNDEGQEGIDAYQSPGRGEIVLGVEHQKICSGSPDSRPLNEVAK